MKKINLRLKWVFRRNGGIYRIARMMWERGQPGKPGGGYSAKLSVALDRAVFRYWKRDAVTDWRFTVLGVRLHYRRSYGGIFV